MLLHDYFDFHAREQPDAPFAVFGDRTMTWREAQCSAHRMAHALQRSGVLPGQRASVLSKNCIESVLFYFAAAKVGVVPVPLNYRLTPSEWQVILDDAAPTFLLARGELVYAVSTLRGDLPGVETWVAMDAAAPDGWTSFDEWLSEAPEARPDHRGRPGDVVYQMYTSGTTGRPKGAMLTHAAVCAHIGQFAGIWPFHRGDRYLIVAPVYHAAATVAPAFTVQNGGTLHIQEDFDPQDVVDALSQDGIAAATLVPAMIQACLMLVPDASERSYEELKYIAYGASPIAANTLRQAMTVFGCDFYQAYGMTETSAVLTLLGSDVHRRALSGRPELLLSCGRPLPGTEIRIVDANDTDVAEGVIGEIIGRGPQLMSGYWNRPEATEEALAGGWMHTGDAGRLDAEGFLYIEDRVKDMIVSGGENIFPREIENVIFDHPAVADAAVIGVPDDRWGETVKAVVVVRADHHLDADELIDFCRGSLAGFKLPRSVDFVIELPRNPSGKVLKKELREPYWRDRTRCVN